MEDELARRLSKGLGNVWTAWLSRGIFGKWSRQGHRSWQWLGLQGHWLVKEFGLHSVDSGWQICGLSTNTGHCCTQGRHG